LFKRRYATKGTFLHAGAETAIRRKLFDKEGKKILGMEIKSR